MTNTAEKSATNKTTVPEPVCSYCGDPIVGQCKTKYSEWIVVLPREILRGDRIRCPLDAKKIYHVSKILITNERTDDEAVLVSTVEKRSCLIYCPDLPYIVKREVACGWPRCDLHCVRCMRIAEEHPLERQKMKEEGTLPEKKRRRKAKEDPYTAERIYARSPARARSNAPTCKPKARKAPTKKKAR